MKTMKDESKQCYTCDKMLRSLEPWNIRYSSERNRTILINLCPNNDFDKEIQLSSQEICATLEMQS